MARLLFQLAKLTLVVLTIRTVVYADAAWARADTDAAALALDTLRAAPPLRTVVRRPLDTAMTPVFAGIELPPTFRDSIVSLARSQVGRRYVFGGTTPRRGFDCSGLVRYVLARVNIEFPRTASLQARIGMPVDRAELLPGDLVSFGPDSVEHIGIYVGDGQFVHASSVAGRVVVSRLDRRPSRLIKPIHGARRLLAVYERPFSVGVLQLASR